MREVSRPSGEIDLVVFDMDGVLAQLDRARRLQLLSKVTGKAPAFLDDVIWSSEFERRAERGEFASGAEYLAEFNHLTGCVLRREQWSEARRAAMTLNARTLALAEAVGEFCQIAMLTNNVSLLLETLPEILPEVKRVFGARAHASCEFHARKPQPEVFERLLQRYGVMPARAVFVDDEPEFVAGARAVGMHGICYRDPESLAEQLTQLGVTLR